MRKLVFGLLLLTALAAPIAIAGSAAAAGSRVKLVLKEVRCLETTAGEAGDELLIKINNATVFGPEVITDDPNGVGVPLALDLDATKEFRKQVTVTLLDDEGPNRDDELIGAVTIRRGVVGDGEQEVTIEQAGGQAEYVLVFKVVRA